MVRAKFVCTSVEKCLNWERSKGFMYRAKFTPVVSGSPENEKFYSLTPSGSVELASYKEDLFVPGQSYYLDFSPAAD